jgi:hypothetical protein
MQPAETEDTFKPDYRAVSWWAEYAGGIRTAFAVTLIVVTVYVAVRARWLP